MKVSESLVKNKSLPLGPPFPPLHLTICRRCLLTMPAASSVCPRCGHTLGPWARRRPA